MKLVDTSLVCSGLIKMQFDGFIMVHSVYLKEGNATHCSAKTDLFLKDNSVTAS